MLGPPASGKSGLALTLIDAGATLVADDRLWLEASDRGLLVWPPLALQGLVEIRGWAPVRLGFRAPAAVSLIARLVASAQDVPRWPAAEGVATRETICGVVLPVLHLVAHDPDAPARVASALRASPTAP